MERTITIKICDGCNERAPRPVVEHRGCFGRHYCLCATCVARGFVLAPSDGGGLERPVGYVVRRTDVAATDEKGRG